MAALIGRRFSQRIAHDLPDGPGAAPAFRAAAEAGIDLRRGAGTAWAGRQAAANGAIGQDVARTDDHARCRTRLPRAQPDHVEQGIADLPD